MGEVIRRQRKGFFDPSPHLARAEASWTLKSLIRGDSPAGRKTFRQTLGNLLATTTCKILVHVYHSCNKTGFLFMILYKNKGTSNNRRNAEKRVFRSTYTSNGICFESCLPETALKRLTAQQMQSGRRRIYCIFSCRDSRRNFFARGAFGGRVFVARCMPGPFPLYS